jgi:hypothetical protein
MRALDRSIAPASPIADLSMRLCEALLSSEGLFLPVRLEGSLTTAEVWKMTDGIKHRLSVFEEPEPFIAALAGFLHNVLGGLHALPVPEDGSALSIPLFDFLPNVPLSVEGIFGVAFNGSETACPFQALKSQLERNLMLASGIDPSDHTSRKEPVPPTKAKDQSPQALIADYLGGTPFAAFLQTPIPFSIPLRARFEHTHIVGGSGHGKTQLLQHLILRDLEQLTQGRGSIVVIDSQGDMLRSIMNLAEFAPGGPLSDRLVFIDPNDIEYPPALNLFDFGLDRLDRYSPLDRERLLNGAIALLALDQLYRALDVLAEHGDAIEQEVFWHSADLFKLDVDLVFYDATTAWFECDEEDVAPETWRGLTFEPLRRACGSSRPASAS